MLQGVGWRRGDPHRRLVAFSPPGRALGCLRSPIQVAPGLWTWAVVLHGDCDLSGLPVFRKDCGVGGGAGYLCPCLSLPESALYSPQGIILWFRGSEVEFAVFLLRCLF